MFSWGFGGYGRLGHNEQKDELVPRLIKVLEGKNIVGVTAGSSFSLAFTEPGKSGERQHRSNLANPYRHLHERIPASNSNRVHSFVMYVVHQKVTSALVAVNSCDILVHHKRLFGFTVVI